MSNHEDKLKIWANEKQRKFLRSRAKRKTFHGGRGSGKTRTLATDLYQCFWELPKGKLVLGGETYVQLDAVVIPGIKAGLETFGFKEYNKDTPEGVYVLGVKAPTNWENPWEKVGKRAIPYTMQFINGFSIHFASEDNAQTHRGINSDAVRVDESAQISEEFLGEIILPTMRANKFRKIAQSPKWKSFYDFSSAAWTEKGQWIYKTETAYLKMMEQRALMSAAEKEKTPPTHLFLESTYRDNADVLPDDYADGLRELLTDLQFSVEVENVRIKKLPNCFYYAFNSQVHTYTPKYSYEFDDKSKVHLYRSNDYLEEKDLEISLDFNADICWTCTAQEVGMEFRLLHSHFEKSSILEPEKNLIKASAQKWSDRYHTHKKRVVHVWGDLSGKNRSANNDGDNKTFFETYIKVLEENKWKVVKRYMEPGNTRNPKHKHKYNLVNLLFEQQSVRTPRMRFNKDNNKVLVLAMMATPVKPDGSYRKDKSSEQLAKNREYATDGTDALDYILWGKYKRFILAQMQQRNQFDPL
jgi:hypothetical protein